MSPRSTAEYNQHESDNLMNIVAVVYGVALTTALISHQQVLLHPLSPTNLLPFMALSAAGILTAYSFYSYVLSIGGDKPYDVTWTDTSKNWHGISRFATDLGLAILYVRLLFAAANVEGGPRVAPKLAGFVFSFILVFVGAVVVRWVRRHTVNRPGVIAALASLGLWAWMRSRSATRDIDRDVEVVIILSVIVYCWLNYLFIYYSWRKTAKPSVKTSVV